jgi:hypothetical protein
MQKPFVDALRIEITRAFPKLEIRNEEQGANRFRAKDLIGPGLQHKISGREKSKAETQKPRNDASGPLVVKVPKAETALGQPFRDDGGHQIAGDDKKHIDSDKAARNEIDLVVVEHYGGHRERSQCIDIVAELHSHPVRGHWCPGPRAKFRSFKPDRTFAISPFSGNDGHWACARLELWSDEPIVGAVLTRFLGPITSSKN